MTIPRSRLEAAGLLNKWPLYFHNSVRLQSIGAKYNLEKVRNSRSGETERRAGMLRAELRYGRIEDILHQGLHSYLTGFLERIADLGGRISQDFLVPLSG